MSSNQPLKKSQKNLNDYSRYSGLVFQMAIIIGAGTFGGRKLDTSLALNFPVFTVTLSLLSIGVALYIVLKDFIKPKND